MVYNTSLYSLSARKSNDIDILIDEGDLSTLDSVMREFGFIQSLDGGTSEESKKEKLIQRMNYHDLVPYFKKINMPFIDCLKVDVNFHFDSKDHEITKAISDEGTEVYSGNGFSIKGLKWTTHLAHMCTHFYREATEALWTSVARDVDFYRLVDVENSMRKFNEEQLIKWCDTVNKFELNKQCYFTLYYLNKFYPERKYEDVMEIIKPSDTTFLNKVNLSGGKTQEREEDFFEQTLDMCYGKDFSKKSIEKMF